MDLSPFLKNCHCYSADQSTSDLLPSDQPAVYAFYDAIRLTGKKPADAIDSYATKRARSIALDLTGLPDQIALRLRGTSERFKGKGKRFVEGLSDDKLEAFYNTLHFLSILSEPLYVGETEDVKTRFIAHHDKDFLRRMKLKGRSPGEFVFFYYAISDQLHQCLETSLIHILSPSDNTIGSLIKPKR